MLEGAGDGEDAAAVYAKQFVANAEAGVGLIIQGNSCLYDEGRTSPGMTIVSTRERMLRLAPMVDAVHRAGASIWIQVGLGGLFAMEAWHEPYASQRQQPLLAASKPPLALRPVYRRAPIHVMTGDDIRAMAVQYGEAAAWAREAGYDGLQLASSNAKLIDQLLSPFWNRRDDEFGGSLAQPGARCSELIRAADRRAGRRRLHRHREGAGGGEGAAVHPPHHLGRGHRAVPARGGASATTRSRRSRCRCSPTRRCRAAASRRRSGRTRRCRRGSGSAAPRRTERAVLIAGYVFGGATARFRPVWNRSRFVATKAAVSIPVLAVGGIRDAHEVDEILDGGQADLVGIGRPVLRRARPARADPRRAARARAVPVLQPLRAGPDARA